MSLADRIGPLCDLLLGAAYADEVFQQREREAVTELLEELSGTALSAELEQRIATFDAKRFDLAATAAVFTSDPTEDRERLLSLVAAINDSDDEVDFSEDDYLRALAKALKLPDEALDGLTIDVEVVELRDDFAKVRKGPPPPPAATKSSAAVDVDIE